MFEQIEEKPFYRKDNPFNWKIDKKSIFHSDSRETLLDKSVNETIHKVFKKREELLLNALEKRLNKRPKDIQEVLPRLSKEDKQNATLILLDGEPIMYITGMIFETNEFGGQCFISFKYSILT